MEYLNNDPILLYDKSFKNRVTDRGSFGTYLQSVKIIMTVIVIIRRSKVGREGFVNILTPVNGK